MKEYPSISRLNSSHIGRSCLAFVKYDGSNLRWEWSKKRGWYKFGTRHHLFDKSDADFGVAIDLFMNMAPQIEEVIKENFPGVQQITAFTEFYGPSSFAGHHIRGEGKTLRLFDICPYKKGILGPREFLKYFGKYPFSPGVIYDGPLTQEFVDGVRSGKYPVVEGVVCKGGEGHHLWMVKIKTDSYRKKLVDSFGPHWQKYWE